MDIRYSTEKKINDHLATLEQYRLKVRSIADVCDYTSPESSLTTCSDELMKHDIQQIAKKIGDVSDVVVIGIGGSSLGVEAIHHALEANTKKRLHVLDAVSDYKIRNIIELLADIPLEKVAICAISKSGTTTETMTNLDVFLHQLRKLHGLELCPYDRLICIGNKNNTLLKKAAALNAHVLSMPEVIGGRYSVFTSVGLFPLHLLGHNIDALLKGLSNALHTDIEAIAAHGAGYLFEVMTGGARTVNFFTFDIRLEKLGRWYRQLTAESLGKEYDVDGKKVTVGFVPTIATPVELHSIGQLYFSGFDGIFTDFVGVKNARIEYSVSRESVFADKLFDKPMQEIASAIEGGVVAAYDERALPYRKTNLAQLSEEAVAEFMGMRMLETMYLANLMNVNAFNQPNVELYKDKTREILEA